MNRIFLNDVLFCLYAAKLLDWQQLNRTNFQKILYFCAVLAPLNDLEWGYEFINAPYGPFNSKILQAPDILVTRYKYATIENAVLTKDSKLRASYRISPQGEEQVKRITRLQRERTRCDWITLVMKILDIYGSKIITKLAYKEPTFRTVRKQNRRAIDLSEHENPSTRLISAISNELRDEYSFDIDTISAQLITYFDYLSHDIGSS